METKTAFVPFFSEDGNLLHLYDSRYDKKVDLTDGKGLFGQVSYTLNSQDINAKEKPLFAPYNDGVLAFDRFEAAGDTYLFENTLHGLKASMFFGPEFAEFSYENNGHDLSEFGAYLPFNFMNKKNGDWPEQLLPSSPYNSPQNNWHYCYFTRPDGKGLLLVCLDEVAAFKLDYSDYCWGHFFTGYRVLKQADKAFALPRPEGGLRLRLYPAESFDAAMAIVADLLELPVCNYDTAWVQVGQKKQVQVLGACDKVQLCTPGGNTKALSVQGGSVTFLAEEFGDYRLTPYCNNKAGLECVVFACDAWKDLTRRSVQAVAQTRDEIMGQTADGKALFTPPHIGEGAERDFNLCEHCMWVWAALYYLRYEENEQIKADVENFFALMLADDPHLMVPRMTMVPGRQAHNIPPYSTYGSNRVQEAFNGINLLLAAYQTFQDKAYLELALAAAKAHADEMYRLGTVCSGDSDYATVTAMILPFVDLARVLKELGDGRAEEMKKAAVFLADFVVSRGLDFPTETAVTEETTREVEEGSMSCAALTVLAVYNYLSPKPEYLAYAKEVLALHNAWTIFTPVAPCHYSTLRWWETIWEGDASGPALCCGHAWTIWRAEADYLYALATGSGKAYLRSVSGFYANLSKSRPDGSTYAIYRLESIEAGNCTTNPLEVSRQNKVGFPQKTDNTLSRYAFARGAATIFDTLALVGDKVIGGQYEQGVLVPGWFACNKLFLADFSGVVQIRTEKELQIYCKDHYTCDRQGDILTITVTA